MLSSMQRPPARQRRGEGTRRGGRGGGVRAMSFRLPGQFRQPASVSLALAQAQSSHAVSEGSDRAGHRAGIPFLSLQCVVSSRTQVAGPCPLALGVACCLLRSPALLLRAFPSLRVT